MTEEIAIVPVTQADREAASAAYYDCYETPPNALWMAKMENGGHDDDPVVQAFARHRISETSRGTETFELAWARMESQGYRYGRSALELVRFGWELAKGEHAAEVTA